MAQTKTTPDSFPPADTNVKRRPDTGITPPKLTGGCNVQTPPVTPVGYQTDPKSTVGSR